MILECKSCQKKFLVPDNAIPSSGRLVQCSSCGNKWTQYPEKKIIQPKKIDLQPKKISDKQIINTKKNKVIVKKKKITKKTGPSIYSREYLEKKHGIKIGEGFQKKTQQGKNVSIESAYFGFYSYLFLTLIGISFLLGILNLTEDIIIFYFPFLEVYIEYLFENINYFRILISDALNIS